MTTTMASRRGSSRRVDSVVWKKSIAASPDFTAPGNASVVVDRLLNNAGSGRPPVFTYTANGSGHTTYATVHVESPSRGERKQGYGYRVTFDDGFFLRNLSG